MIADGPALELTNVGKTYAGGLEAVRDFNFSLARGQLLALVGESGCGKTTTLKLINRLEALSCGTIRVFGQDIAETDPVSLRRSMGWVMQGDGLFPHLSVVENVSVVPRLRGWADARVRQQARHWLDRVQLPPDEFADRMPEELSGGQRQRVGFARGLAGEPDILLMDEPFSALDPLTRDRLQQDFNTMQSELGLTAVLVTHDMAEALLLADVIAVMRDGELVQAGRPADLLSSPANDYVGRMLDTPLRQARVLSRLEKA